MSALIDTCSSSSSSTLPVVSSSQGVSSIGLLEVLPVDFLQHQLLPFLPRSSRIDLLSTCKHVTFVHLLRCERYIVLKGDMLIHVLSEESMQQRVFSCLSRPNQQLKLYCHDILSEVRNYHLLQSFLTKYASSIHEFSIQSLRVPSEEIDVMTLMADLQSVHLIYATKCLICKVTPLHIVSKLDIGECQRIVDLHLLTNLIEFKLCAYEGIDLTGLSKLQRLEVIDAPTIQGLESLVSLEQFQWQLVGMKLTDAVQQEQMESIRHLSKWPHLQELRLLNVATTYLTRIDYYPQLKRIELYDYHHLQDISNLSHVLRVELTNCTLPHDLTCLKHCKRLAFVECNGLYDLIPFTHVQELCICDCEDLKEIPYLPKLRSIEIYGMDHLQSFENLTHLFAVHLCYYSGDVRDISNLGHVQVLSVTGCCYITTFGRPLGKLQNWDLSSTEVEDLTGFESLYELNISNCKQVKNVGHLSSLHVLHASGCINAKDVHLLVGKVPHLICNELKNDGLGVPQLKKVM